MSAGVLSRINVCDFSVDYMLVGKSVIYTSLPDEVSAA